MNKKKEKLRERIDYLYEKNRSLLTLQERKIFNLPKDQRKKCGYDRMLIWIDMAEYIFEQQIDKQEQKTLHWFYPQQRTN